jgi:hypothetical protein
MGYRSLPFCQVAKSYLLGITESQYRGERGARVPSRPSATGLVSQSATDRDDELRNHDDEHLRRGEQFLVTLFIALPTLALIAAVPFTWGWGLTWIDIGLAVFFIYCAASA